MYVFASHCPSYYFFKNVIKELQRKDLLKEPVKLADEYLIHYLNFDHSLPSIPATLLPSILSKLLFYIQTNEINLLDHRVVDGPFTVRKEENDTNYYSSG
jgi:hypothetical protein